MINDYYLEEITTTQGKVAEENLTKILEKLSDDKNFNIIIMIKMSMILVILIKFHIVILIFYHN